MKYEGRITVCPKDGGKPEIGIIFEFELNETHHHPTEKGLAYNAGAIDDIFDQAIRDAKSVLLNEIVRRQQEAKPVKQD
jgi:hypothetical protein